MPKKASLGPSSSETGKKCMYERGKHSCDVSCVFVAHLYQKAEKKRSRKMCSCTSISTYSHNSIIDIYDVCFRIFFSFYVFMSIYGKLYFDM